MYSYKLKGFPEFYNDMTHHLFSEHPMTELAERELTRLLGIKDRVMVVEYAAGTGRIIHRLAQLAHGHVHFVVTDHSNEMLDAAKDRLMSQERVEFTFLQHAMETPLTAYGGMADLVILSAGSIMHLLTLDDVQACIESIHCVLAPGGTAIVDIMSRDMILGDTATQMEVPAQQGGYWTRTRTSRHVEGELVKDAFELSKFDQHHVKVWEAMEGWTLRLTTPTELLAAFQRCGYTTIQPCWDQQPDYVSNYHFYSIVAVKQGVPQ
jgi:ubiquinone/menaquinone biosynthesis C-methylase UbiE